MEIISQIKLRGVPVENNRDDSTEYLEIRDTYVLKDSIRGEMPVSQTIPLSEEDVLEFHFDDDTVWISDPASMQELFPEAVAQLRALDQAVFELPSVLSIPADERGVIKDIALKVFKVFAKKKILFPIIHDLAGKLEDKVLNQEFKGLVHVKQDFSFAKEPVKESSLHLLLIHGTASSTLQSFGDLRLESDEKPVETALWQHIFSHYQENVLAFEHESLTKSPLDNVLELVKELPKNATLHLLTQSRGGLVGELLAKFFDEKAGRKGFTKAEKEYLRKHDRGDDAKRIEEIESVIADKNIRIDKFVRVACPANGTTLASKRLDIWLNVIFNVLGLALAQSTNPVYVAFKNLLTAVVQSKDDPSVLPGLAPQNPEFAMNKVINNIEPVALLSSPLLIVSGDNQLSFKLKGLLGILSNLFFLGKNDFVVNTTSMYQGARRASGNVQFFLDESPDVSHFNYFKNPSTRGAILRALQSVGSARVEGFSAVPENVLAQSALRGIAINLSFGQLTPKKVSGTKPIVVLLPGIMGSNLDVDDKPIWVNFLKFVAGELVQLEHSVANNKKVTAPSIVGDSYTKLYNHLSGEYDVTVFPFDWRLPMHANTTLFNAKIGELLAFNQPVKLVAHSMGGVLVRDFMIDHPATWETLNSSPEFSLVFLGAPLSGSFRIASVLFGRDSLIKKLGLIDTKNSKKELLAFFTQFPGILSLLPFTTDAANDFGNVGTWEKMRDAEGDADWPIPAPELLADFKRYRDNVLAKNNSLDFSNAVYIAGLADGRDGTVSGYRIVPRGILRRDRLKLEFLASREGDGSVTWESGIPNKLIQSGNVYFSTVEHGELANDQSLFGGISDILKVGSTRKISKTRPMLSRGLATEFPVPESFDFDQSDAGLRNAILGLRSPESNIKTVELPITVSVTHGNLKYASYPLLIGHFERDGIMSAEKAVDEHLGRELTRRLQLGLYPGEVGTSMQVASTETSDFKGVIILGLGKQGELNERYLVNTVEQGVASYLTSLISAKESPFVNDQKAGISALIIGSGYGGLGIENCIRAILQGIQNANQKIRAAYAQKAIRIDQLEFIELYQDNTLACVKALKTLERAEGTGLAIQRSSTGIAEQMGRRLRIPLESTVEWWTRITVRRYLDEDNVPAQLKNGLLFTITTDAARIEERPLFTSGEEITKLLKAASSDGKWTPELAKTLFELLIPNDFKSLIKRQSNIILQLDEFTASFPWELLQDTLSDGFPLSINSGLIRQFTTKNFRIIINSVNTRTALVIADPDLEDKNMQLAAALVEGAKVSELLLEKNYNVVSENQASPDRILTKLYSQDYKIIHLAGHGVFEYGERKQTGMLIGKDTFLTPAHIDQMSNVPELVFVNCCFLGETVARSEAYTQNRYQLAANLGTQLIRIGVKAVVVAGWAVSDDAALYFAECFYKAMLEGKMFGEAVKRARKAVFEIYKNRSNTWGAYQSYGDPFYRLTAAAESNYYEYDFEIPALAEMELTNLKNELDSGSDTNRMVLKLNAINLALKKDNLSNANITELLASIYAALGLYKEAVEHYEKLGTIQNATFTVKALEQFCNVKVKLHVRNAKENPQLLDQSKKGIEEVIAYLDRLIMFGKTAERYYILGSTNMRLALLSKVGNKEKAYKAASEAYHQATVLVQAKEKYYPITNWIPIEHALSLKNPAAKPANEDAAKPHANNTKGGIKDWTKLLEAELAARPKKSIDKQTFWDLVAEADIKFCLQLLKYTKKDFDELAKIYQRIWNFSGHEGNRLGTLEHLDILIDLYGFTGANDIAERIVGLKGLLEGGGG